MNQSLHDRSMQKVIGRSLKADGSMDAREEEVKSEMIKA
jgi:hypothetical protein